MLAAEGCGRSLEFAEKMSWTTTFSIEKASTESQSVSAVFSDRACSRYGWAIICRMQSGCQNWMSRWRSRVGTVNLGACKDALLRALVSPAGYGLLNLVTRRDVRQLRLLRQPQFRRAEFAGRVTRFAIHGHWQRPLHPC